MNDEERGRAVIARWGWELALAPNELLPADAELILVRGYRDPLRIQTEPPRIIARCPSRIAAAIGRAFRDNDLFWIGTVTFEELSRALGKPARRIERS